MDKKKEDEIADLMRPTPPPEPKSKKKKQTAPPVLEKVEDPDDEDDIELDEPKRRPWIMWVVWFFVIVVLGSFLYLSYLVYVANTQQKSEEKVEQSVVTPAQQTTEATVVYVDSAEGLNLREQPDATSPVVLMMPAKSKLTVLDEQNGWLKVTYNDKTGWCLKELTTTIQPQ